MERTSEQTKTRSRAVHKPQNQIEFRRRERLPSRRPHYTIASSAHGVPERSRATGLVFQAILGVAACLALVGVVASAQSEPAPPSTSPDAPPPAVFVQFD